MTPNEAQRLAAMGNALRPDWPLRSLATFLDNHRAKAYRDVAVALAWIACDPTTATPARMNENGPWWKATQAGEPTHVVSTTRCPEHPANRLWDCADCEAEATPPPDDLRALIEAGRQSAEPRPESRRIV